MINYNEVVTKAAEYRNNADELRTAMRNLMATKSRINCRKFEADFDEAKYEADMTKILIEQQLLKEAIVLVENNGII